MKRTTFQQFDVVQILTTRNVQWRCDIEGTTDPNGNWSVVAAYPANGILLIQKGDTLARIPASDVRRIANYDLDKVFAEIHKINDKYFKTSNQNEDNND